MSAVPINRKRPFAYSAAIFSEDVRSHELARERPQRRVVRHRVAEDARDQAALLEHVLRRNGGVDLRQRRIVLFAEKRERRDQRARADAGDELELGPRSGSRPAIEQARRVGPLVAAPGDGQVDRRGQGSRLPLRRPVFLLLAERVDARFWRARSCRRRRRSAPRACPGSRLSRSTRQVRPPTVRAPTRRPERAALRPRVRTILDNELIVGACVATGCRCRRPSCQTSNNLSCQDLAVRASYFSPPFGRLQAPRPGSGCRDCSPAYPGRHRS